MPRNIGFFIVFMLVVLLPACNGANGGKGDESKKGSRGELEFMTKLDLNNKSINQDSAPFFIALNNPSDEQLTITKIDLTGDTADLQFKSIQEPGKCMDGFTLGPKKWCSLAVKINADKAGPHKVELQIKVTYKGLDGNERTLQENANGTINWGSTTLNPSASFMKALDENNADAIADLVKNGFDPNADINIYASGSIQKLPPVHCMMRNWCKYNSAILDELIRNGAQIDKRIDTFNGPETPIMLAVESRNDAGVSDLLRLGADPNASHSNGDTPLHDAVMKASYELLGGRTGVADPYLRMINSFLSSDKTNARQKNGEGHTPLYYAYNQNLKLSPELLKKVQPIIKLFNNKGIEEYE
jgi:hypothetical protein